jgi:hypothetical protein
MRCRAAASVAFLTLAGCAQSRMVVAVDRPLSPERREWLQSQLEDEVTARIHLADSEAGALGHGLSFDPNEVRWMDEMGRVRWAPYTQLESIVFNGLSPWWRRAGMLVGGVVGFLVAGVAALLASAGSNPPYGTSQTGWVGLAVGLGGGLLGGLLGGSAGDSIGRRFGPTTTIEFVPR